MCFLHYSEKQRASNLPVQEPGPNAARLRANQPPPAAVAGREESPGTPTRPAPAAPAGASAGPHAVAAPARPGAPLPSCWGRLTIKERASACRGGIASAGRSCTLGRGVCRRRRLLGGAPATLKMPARSPGPAERPRAWCPAAAFLCPAGWPGVGAFLRKLALGRGRSGGSGGAPSCADPAVTPRPALRPLRSSVPDPEGGESRAQGSRAAPRLPALGAPGVLPRAPGTSSGWSWGPGPGCRALLALPRDWAPLCAGRAGRRGQPGCCSRRRLPLLRRRRPLPAFPAGPEAAAESRSG